MSSGTRRGLALLGAALALGILGDLLLRQTPLGLNVLLWTLAFVAALAALLRFLRAPLHQGRRWMVGPLVLFAALFVWRDSLWLAALNLFALFVAVSLGALREPAVRVPVAGLVDYVRAGGRAAVSTVAGSFPLLFEDVKWREVPRGTGSREATAVARGVALALPLLVLFGALFVAADEVFESLVQGLVPDMSDPATHVVVVLLFAWASAGLLRGLLAPEAEPPPFVELERRRPLTLGATEIAVALGALDLLFLAFVLVQFRYLFGGDGHVQAQTGLTYAQYARHGFFELVTVAVLTLPLLLAADWSLRRERPRDERMFRVLAGALIVLLFVVMASALQRMRLYQREYGLTELRVYTTGFMVWLGVVLAWLAATVLRSRRRLFAVGALVSGFAAIFVVNVLNPDALIARVNTARPNLDAHYLGGLSDDAVPTLVARLPRLDPDDRAWLGYELAHREPIATDWRTFNLSRDRAAEALNAHRAELDELAREFPPR